MSANLSRWTKGRRGAVAMTYAIILPLMGLSVFGAVDLTNGYAARDAAQGALDGAALATARRIASNPDGVDVQALGERNFKASLAGAGVADSIALSGVSFTYDRDSQIVTGKAKGGVKTWFGAIVGFPRMEFDMTSGAIAEVDRTPLEIAIVLDVSGSMFGSKLASLKTAVHSLLDTVFSAQNAGQNSRVGFVPYNSYVNLGSKRGFTDSLDDAGTDTQDNSATTLTNITLCPVGRTSVGRDRDAPPRNAKFQTANCAGSNYRVVPLTDDAAGLHAAVDSLTAGGGTGGALGFEWGWYMLSGQWRQEWKPATRKPLPYGESNKIIIMMTDGDFNNDPGFGPYERFQSLCKNARDLDVTVYTVAFQAPAGAKVELKRCAGDSANYFEPVTGDELVSVFRKIASRITAPRLAR